MFGRKLTDFEPVKEALVAYVTRAAEKLRRDRLLARHMQVFLHNSPFATDRAVFQQRHRLPAPPPDQRHRRADRATPPPPCGGSTGPAPTTPNAASC